MRRAQIIWHGGAVTNVDESGGTNGATTISLDRKRLRILNTKNPDPSPQLSPRPQPDFITELSLWTHADECVPLGAWIGARYMGDEADADGTMLSRWLIISPSDAKQKPAYPVGTYPEYAAISQAACLEGGKKIVVPIGKRSDPLLSAEHAPDAGGMARALELLGVDQGLYRRRRKFYDHLFSAVLKVNPSSLDPTIPLGKHNLGGMINPFIFAARTGTNDTFADYANVFQFGIRERDVSNRLCFYWYLRSIITGALLTNDMAQLQAARILAYYKDAQGFLEPASGKKRYRWAGEHSIGGVMGDAESKQFRGDHQLLALIFPNDPDIVETAGNCTRGAVLSPAAVWDGTGGAREFGNKIHDLLYIWKTTGTEAARSIAAHLISEVFRLVIKTEDVIRENKGSPRVSGGEGLNALVNCYRWLDDGRLITAVLPSGATFGQANPNFRLKLDTIRDRYLKDGGRPAGIGLWQPCYYWNSDGQASQYEWGNGVWGSTPGGSAEQGIFWLPLRRFCTADQQAQMDAIEEYTFRRFETIDGADTPSWGPGILKWISAAAAGVLL